MGNPSIYGHGYLIRNLPLAQPHRVRCWASGETLIKGAHNKSINKTVIWGIA